MANRWVGSLQNCLMSNMVNGPKPVVGMGATELLYTDRHAYEVIAVKDDRHITVRQMQAIRKNRSAKREAQEYELLSNEENRHVNLFLTKKGQWVERFDDRSYGSTNFLVGRAEEYFDESF